MGRYTFKMMIDGIQLKDTFAMKNTNKLSCTYIHTNGKSTKDRIFISKDYILNTHCKL